MKNSENGQKLSIKILKGLGIGSLFLIVSILSPQFPYVVLKAYLRKKFRQPYTNRQIQNSLVYLKRKKFVSFQFKDNKLKVILTKFGQKHLNKILLSEIKIPAIKWDNRWRLLTFDIPETKQSARHIFAKKLKELGFFHFQRSVFIFPYPCEEQIDQIVRYFDIRSDVHLMLCNRFPGDQTLLKRFKIS